MITFRKHRFAFIIMSLSTIAAALAPLFLIAGCHTLQQTPPELKARETLRAMTRGGVLPAEDAVARIESDFPKTTAGSLARIVHARIKLNAKDDAAALLLTAKAYEQTGDSTRALAAYRRIYFFAPASAEAQEAATALMRLNSALSPTTTEEAIARAEKLFAAKRSSEAFDAYTDAFVRFPTSATPELQARRAIAAANARRYADATAALT